MNLDIQGHRGCRGLLPENTIPAFEHAIELGVNTLEFDVVISKDHQVIVSHEPFMSHEIATSPDGQEITKENQLEHNIYALDYEGIKTYDVGTKYVERFPDQKKIKVHKPSLKDVVHRAEFLAPEILYNIEIKRKKEWDLTHHPSYQTFADLVIKELEELGVMDRTTVQCFDVETLQYIHAEYPHVRLVYLIMNEDAPESNIEKLGFTPFVYSPYYLLVNKQLVDYCKVLDMQLIPWTVNEEVDMKKLIDIGVTGIITDYPDRLIKVAKEISKGKS